MGKKYVARGIQYIEEEVTVVIDADAWERVYGEPFDPATSITDTFQLHDYADETRGDDPDITETGGAKRADEVNGPCIRVTPL